MSETTLGLKAAAILGLEAIDNILSSHEGQAEHAQLKAAFDALQAALNDTREAGSRGLNRGEHE